MAIAMRRSAEGGEDMSEATLYDRLGGTFAIAAVVDRFSDALIHNPIVGQQSRNPSFVSGITTTLADRLGATTTRCYATSRDLTIAADLGGEYLVEHRFEPINYHGIEIDPSSLFDEADYGND